MQTITFAETAEWLDAQYSEGTKKVFLSGNLWHFLGVKRPADSSNENVSLILKISHDLAIARERIIVNPEAVEVLKAFKLEALLDADLPVSFAEKATNTRPQERPVDEKFYSLVSTISHNWDVLQSSVAPIRKLLVPKQVEEETDFDNILTIELRYPSDSYPQARTLSQMLDNIATLYESVSITSGNKDFAPLLVMYANSGSDFRFDFRVLKGMGEPIKQLKALFVDVWRAIRFRKAEDFRTNGKAIIEGLELLDRIDAKQRKYVVSPEDANRLKLRVNRAMLALLDAGALPREVPVVETVSNNQLIHGLQQKLLPPAPEEKQNQKPTKTARARKRGAAKKATKKTSNTTHNEE